MSEAPHTQLRPFAPAPVHSDWILAIADEQDRSSFVALFHHFAPRLKAYLLRLGMPGNVAEELVQETMLLVWRKAGQFDPARATPSAWIYTIARNLRIDMLRRERNANDPRLSEPEQATCSPEQELDLVESERRVRHALDVLPADQAALLRLSYFEDRSHAEIADHLRLPLGTVKSRLRRAAAQLREILSDRY
ncbi:sigma-70 family RNA polymerase sigma factor [Phenylobacterium sp.]|uniref:sigma-70 family RNA polymerase sigma factor n=1 Tax=Phenylobacterium sp. TaxID=1871053 RepID=UPI00286E3B2B|nr:sigma-70 family RNA polymerase sigma factor [Phenylobacterium sp.]